MQNNIKQIVQHYQVVVICVYVFICVVIKLYMYTNGYMRVYIHTHP